MSAPEYAGPFPVPPEISKLVVYRYFSLTHGLEALQTGRWKIGRMSELNDPFDCRPKFINDGSQPENFVDKVMDNWGLLCFSESVTDPVLWSHYADSHKGLALGFTFYGDEMGLAPVIYSNELPTVSAAEIITARNTGKKGAAADYVFRAGYLTKAPSWKYEREYRKMLTLDSCDMYGRHFFQELPADSLSTVILGARCEISAEDVRRILFNSKNATNKTRYYAGAPLRCRKSQDSYQLEIVDWEDKVVPLK